MENDNAARTKRDTRCRSVLLNRSMRLILCAHLLIARYYGAGITPFVHHVSIGIKRGMLTVRSGNLCPQALGTHAVTISDVQGNHLARLGLHGELEPLLMRLLSHETGYLSAFTSSRFISPSC